jgi:hypothetical protein
MRSLFVFTAGAAMLMVLVSPSFGQDDGGRRYDESVKKGVAIARTCITKTSAKSIPPCLDSAELKLARSDVDDKLARATRQPAAELLGFYFFIWANEASQTEQAEANFQKSRGRNTEAQQYASTFGRMADAHFEKLRRRVDELYYDALRLCVTTNTNCDVINGLYDRWEQKLPK